MSKLAEQSIRHQIEKDKNTNGSSTLLQVRTIGNTEVNGVVHAKETLEGGHVT